MISVSRLPLIALVAIAAACSSPMSKFYTLAPTVRSEAAAKTNLAVGVGPVTVPAAVDRPQFVLQVAPNRVTLQEYHRWAAPLGEEIAQTVAADLAVLLGTPDVAPLPAMNFQHDFRVIIDVQRFQSIPGESVKIEAVWSILDSEEPSRTQSHRTTATEKVAGSDFEALAAAHSRALGQLSRQIAKALREQTQDG